MILVMLGTQNNSFYRLLEEIEKNINDGIINEEVVVQAGYTKFKSDKMRIFDFISQDELDKLQDKADLIITHGGVGSIISSIEKEKKIIAVARLNKYLEHVNDHQKDIVKKFDDDGFIIGIDDVKKLQSAIIKSKEFKPKKYMPNNQKLLTMVDEFVEKTIKRKD